jgi:hypothetical protein
VVEQTVHLLDPSSEIPSRHNGYISVMPSPGLHNYRRQGGLAACGGGETVSSPDSHLDEALRLLQMTTNHLHREP